MATSLGINAVIVARVHCARVHLVRTVCHIPKANHCDLNSIHISKANCNDINGIHTYLKSIIGT